MSDANCNPVFASPTWLTNWSASNLFAIIVPLELISLLNIAFPASDMSNVRAVIVALLSTPLNTISLLFVADLITKSEESLLNLPNSVPSSFKTTSAPLASSVISPSASIVRSAPSDIVEPLIVISSTVNVVSVPNDVIFGCVACVVAVFGAKPAIVATVAAWPVKLPTKEFAVIVPLALILDAVIGPKILTLLADVNFIISWPLSLLFIILNLPRVPLNVPVPTSIIPLLVCIWVPDSANDVAPPTNILVNEPVKLVVVPLALILPEAVILVNREGILVSPEPSPINCPPLNIDAVIVPIVAFDKSIVSPLFPNVNVLPFGVIVPPPKKVKSTGVPEAPTSISLIVPSSPNITVPSESIGFIIISEPEIFSSPFLLLSSLKNSNELPFITLCFIF